MIGIPSSSNSHGARRLSAWGALTLFAAAVLLLGLARPVSLAVADQGPVQTSSRSGGDIAEIKSIVKQHRLSLSDSFLEKAHGYSDIVKFCETFLADLKAARVEYVKPVLTTDDPNHPELQRYRGCKKYEHTLEQRSKPDYVYHDLSDIGTARFRLYRLELDGNPANGQEEVVYGEKKHTAPRFGEYGPVTSLRGSYAQVDVKSCMLTFSKPFLVQSEFSGVKDAKTALIQYRGSPYIVELIQTERKFNWEPNYLGRFWGSPDTPGIHNVSRCSFGALKED